MNGYMQRNDYSHFSRIDVRFLYEILQEYNYGLSVKSDLEYKLASAEHELKKGYSYGYNDSFRENNIRREMEEILYRIEEVKGKLANIEGKIVEIFSGDADSARKVTSYFIKNRDLPKDFLSLVQQGGNSYFSNFRNNEPSPFRNNNGYDPCNPRIRNSTGTGITSFRSTPQQNNNFVTYKDRFQSSNGNDDSDYLPMYGNKQNIQEPTTFKQNAPQDFFETSDSDILNLGKTSKRDETKEVVEYVVSENNVGETILLYEGVKINKELEMKIENLPYRVLIQKSGLSEEQRSKFTNDIVFENVTKKIKHTFRYDKTSDTEGIMPFDINIDNIEVFNHVDVNTQAPLTPVEFGDKITVIDINKTKGSEVIKNFNPSVFGRDASNYLASLLGDNSELVYKSDNGDEIDVTFKNYSIENGEGIIGIHIPTTTTMIPLKETEYPELYVDDQSTVSVKNFISSLAGSISETLRSLSTSTDLISLIKKYETLKTSGKLVKGINIPKEIITHIGDIIVKSLNDISAKSCLTDEDVFSELTEGDIETSLNNLKLLIEFNRFNIPSEKIERYIKRNIISQIYQMVTSLAIEKTITTYVGDDNIEYKRPRYKLVYNIADIFTVISCSKNMPSELYDWFIGNETNIIITKDSFPYVYNILKATRERIRQIDNLYDGPSDETKFNVVIRDLETGRMINFVAHPTLNNNYDSCLYVLSLRK